MATKSRKSSSLVNSRRSTKENVLPKRLSQSKDKTSSSIINEDDFAYHFRKYCVEEGTQVNPLVRTIVNEPTPGIFLQGSSSLESQKSVSNKDAEEEKESPLPEVLIANNEQGLYFVIFKQFFVDRPMLIALKKALKIYNTVTILKSSLNFTQNTVLKQQNCRLEFCSLSEKEIWTLHTILKRFENITELSVNGNPNTYQNHYLLLKETKLKQLSLRFCKIDDRGMKKIVEKLQDPKNILLYLNLSSNYLGDDGAKQVATMLRSNRSIISVNLADNWITDVGCIAIVKVLQKFPLLHEEVVLRRRQNLAFLLKKRELARQCEVSTEYMQKLSQNSIGKSSILSGKKSKKSSCSDRLSTGSIGSTRKRGSLMSIESMLVQEYHPFVFDSYLENKEIYCKGNKVLSRLNLAYNKITAVGLRAIIDCLEYQRSTSYEEGLTAIILNGNTASSCCMEMNEINELLSLRLRKSMSRSSKKRLSSGLSVRLSIP